MMRNDPYAVMSVYGAPAFVSSVSNSCDGTIPTAAQFVRVRDHEGRATGDEAARVGRVT